MEIKNGSTSTALPTANYFWILRTHTIEMHICVIYNIHNMSTQCGSKSWSRQKIKTDHGKLSKDEKKSDN